jgi:acetyl-CoA hydrolase
VQVLVTEHGVADLRGKDPLERARIVIDNCAAPEYRDQLNEYLTFVRVGHEALSFRSSFAMHHKFALDGDMRGVVWSH